MKTYMYKDSVYSFEGNISLQLETDWVMPWRIDYAKRDFYPFLTNERAKQCAGIRLCFTTSSRNIILNMTDIEAGTKLDLVVNNAFDRQVVLENTCEKICFEKLSEGLKQIEIWLDPEYTFKLKNITIDDDAIIYKTVNTKKKWVHYGSSISHSRLAEFQQDKFPSKIWTALVAQKMNLHLTNLGFGGNCVIEPMIGRLIRDLPADYITLKLGINVYTGALMARTFSPNVIGLIQIIREKHPTTPLALISPICSPPREKVIAEKGDLTLEQMRSIHEGIVKSCTKYGDSNIYYVDGLKVFGYDEVKYMPDKLHPNTEGQLVLAENFIKEVFGRFYS